MECLPLLLISSTPETSFLLCGALLAFSFSLRLFFKGGGGRRILSNQKITVKIVVLFHMFL